MIVGPKLKQKGAAYTRVFTVVVINNASKPANFPLKVSSSKDLLLLKKFYNVAKDVCKSSQYRQGVEIFLNMQLSGLSLGVTHGKLACMCENNDFIHRHDMYTV